MSTGLDDPTMSEEERTSGIDKVKGLDDLASVNGGVADLRNTYMVK